MPVVAKPLLLGSEAETRFWPQVDKSGECWLWTGTTVNGYGTFWTRGSPRYARAHRVAYTLIRGEPDLTLELDHLCRVKLCVNPWHIEAVPHRINIRRSDNPMGINARKTHCKNGHELRPETVYSPPSKPGSRVCKLCPNWLTNLERVHKYRRRKRERRLQAA